MTDTGAGGSHVVYLDVCCLNRPFDDQTQDRIRLEAEAVLLILARLEAGEWEWIGGDALTYEIAQTPDSERRERVQLLATAAHRRVALTDSVVARGQQLEALGFHPADALHVASAEEGGATVCLTTDDRLLSRARRHARTLRVRVANPLAWLAGVLGT